MASTAKHSSPRISIKNYQKLILQTTAFTPPHSVKKNSSHCLESQKEGVNPKDSTPV